MSTSKSSFSLALKESRNLKNLSLRELSASSGVTTSYIARLEDGRKNSPSLKVVQLLSNALDQDLAKFLDEQPAEVRSIQELILNSDFKLGNKVASAEEKEILASVLDNIVTISEELNQPTLNSINEVISDIDE